MQNTMDDKKLESSPRRHRGLIVRLIVYPIILVLAVMLFIAITTQVNGTPERARRVHCMNNLKQLGIALHFYSLDNKDVFSPDLQTLYNKYASASDTEMFVCRSSGKRIAKKVTPTDYATGKAADISAKNMSYCYVVGLKSTDPPEYILAFDEEANHKGDGINVLYVGQNVIWQTDIKAIHGQLAKQEQELKAQGREMRVIRPSDTVGQK